MDATFMSASFPPKSDSISCKESDTKVRSVFCVIASSWLRCCVCDAARSFVRVIFNECNSCFTFSIIWISGLGVFCSFDACFFGIFITVRVLRSDSLLRTTRGAIQSSRRQPFNEIDSDVCHYSEHMCIQYTIVDLNRVTDQGRRTTKFSAFSHVFQCQRSRRRGQIYFIRFLWDLA